MAYVTATKALGKIKLELTETRLSQRDYGNIAMYVRLSDIRRAVKSGRQEIFGRWTTQALKGEGMGIDFWPDQRRIGCCTFSTRSFNKILKAAKVL